MNYKILYRFPLVIFYLIELLLKDFLKFFFKSKNNNLSNKRYEILHF